MATDELGLASGEEVILLDGASDIGFADPGHGTAGGIAGVRTVTPFYLVGRQRKSADPY